ncbi:MAG TPA: DUF5818 domain-containing protein [Terriglobales bacterium]|nr:DUF5818 domain-containing protein [Terriglobales bacterium]
MKLETNSQIALAFFLVIAPLAFSQDGTLQPCPYVTPGTLGCELVAWSQLQEPVPLPEPDTKPVPPPDKQRDAQPGQSASSQAQPPASRQSITGIIVRHGEKCILRAGANTTYQLDNQNKARQYQDKRVKIVGRLDVDSATFHIESIELAP